MSTWRDRLAFHVDIQFTGMSSFPEPNKNGILAKAPVQDSIEFIGAQSAAKAVRFDLFFRTDAGVVHILITVRAFDGYGVGVRVGLAAIAEEKRENKNNSGNNKINFHDDQI
jgi:hypothetical protein